MASKDVERMYLDRFFQDVAWPASEVLPSEAPDFIVTICDRQVGVEVRRVFKGETANGSVARRGEGERAGFLGRVADLYYALGGSPIDVKWITRGSWRRGDERAVALRLMAAAPAVEWETIELGEPFSHENPQAFVTRLPDASGPYRRWRCISDSVGWVRRVAWSDVEDVVREKAARLGAYQQCVRDVVLLLIADRGSESSMLEYADSELAGQSHGFSAIFWQEYLIRSIRIA